MRSRLPILCLQGKVNENTAEGAEGVEMFFLVVFHFFILAYRHLHV